tara:strand:- start:634 stop:897 length:264 start_codon:yes stop_codon:yes gene_type:complete
MNTTSALKFTRLLSYVTMTANGILNISSKIASKATDVVLDRRRYKVEVIVDGATIRTHDNCSTAKVQTIMNASSKLGISQLIVTEME